MFPIWLSQCWCPHAVCVASPRSELLQCPVESWTPAAEKWWLPSKRSKTHCDISNHQQCVHCLHVARLAKLWNDFWAAARQKAQHSRCRCRFDTHKDIRTYELTYEYRIHFWYIHISSIQVLPGRAGDGSFRRKKNYIPKMPIECAQGDRPLPTNLAVMSCALG